MILETALGLFFTGLVLGSTRCMLSCAPLLILYIAGTKEGWKEGLKATLIFSLARLSAYILLGFLAGLVGVFITNLIQEGSLSTYLIMGMSIFISLVAVLMILGKELSFSPCQRFKEIGIQRSTLSMAISGFTIGFASYCTPFFGILAYIASTVKSPLLGALYGLSFGLGASLLTPLVVAGVLSSVIPRLIFSHPSILKIFRRACGLLLLLWGIRLFISASRGVFL